MDSNNEDNIYFQRIVLKMEMPDGRIVKQAFLGPAMGTKRDWDKIKKSNKPLGELLKSDDDLPPIMIEQPQELVKLLSDNPNVEDVVDIIREESHKYFQSNES